MLYCCKYLSVSSEKKVAPLLKQLNERQQKNNRERYKIMYIKIALSPLQICLKAMHTDDSGKHGEVIKLH